MNFHVLTSAHKCNMCNTSFGDAQRLQKHKLLAHEASASATSSNNSDSQESTICYICGHMFEGNNEFLSHVDKCKNRLTPKNNVCVVTPPVAPTASTHASNVSMSHPVEGNNTREYLKRVINETLMGGVQPRREPV